MNDILPKVLQHFLFSLSLGTAAFSFIASPKLTGAGFMKLITGHGFIFLALAVILFFALAGVPPLSWLIVAGVALLSLGIQWKFYPDSRTNVLWAIFGLQLLATVLLLNLVSTSAWDFSILMSSALFLGVVHYSMLLGHYYLVVPKLTEKPLLVCLRITWLVMALKLLLSIWGTYQARPYMEEGTTLGDGYIFNTLIIIMRWLWGYLAIAVLSWFAWKLCRMRSIQSATGVLYIMVFFVFVGELLSIYLYLKNGLII